ncbi:MAG: feruloyl-CoA synthase [Rhodospirillales bacterium]|nr:feruloyl-CoA synthase [Rhodospirillales bacterium]
MTLNISRKCLNLAEPAVELNRKDNGEILLKSSDIIGAYPKNLGVWVAKWAEKTPDNIFLAEKIDNDNFWNEITYQDFLKKTKSVGQALIDRKLSIERPVAILSDNSIDNALLLFGAMHVGIPVVPISPAYSLMSQDLGKLKKILQITSPGLVYASDNNKFLRALNITELSNTEKVVSTNLTDDNSFVEFNTLVDTNSTSDVGEAYSEVNHDTIAKILFTSGSTGQPKGVINTQRMLCSNQQAISQVWKFLEDKPPVTVDWLPWNHTFGGNHNLNMILRNGGTLYIDSGKPAPGLIDKTVANLKEISPTIYFNVPRGFDMLLPYFETDNRLRETFFRNLDVIFYAAAALTQSTWDKLEALSRQTIGEQVMMLSGWGATETAPDCTQVYWPISKAGVIGIPIPSTKLKLTPNEGKLEIKVKGPNVTPGYWKQPELTKRAFDEEGYYRIGDAVRFEDIEKPEKGIIFDGRVAENFKLSSGTWVSVGNIRTDILAKIDRVAQDIVIAGHDRQEIGILIFPNINSCKKLCRPISEETSNEEILRHKNVINELLVGLNDYNLKNKSTSRKVARALFLVDPPDIDSNEITDKGYINQRAVLEGRSNYVSKLFDSGVDIIIL